MTRQQLGGKGTRVGRAVPLDEARQHRVVGWAMVVAERVVAYVPEEPRIPGGALLNTYSSLDSADQLLAYAGIHSVREWSALLGEPAARRAAASP
ncbi:MAG: hypothetical protein ACRDSL_23160 [Pseudonocardiaceae bacterium]